MNVARYPVIQNMFNCFLNKLFFGFYTSLSFICLALEALELWTHEKVKHKPIV